MQSSTPKRKINSSSSRVYSNGPSQPKPPKRSKETGVFEAVETNLLTSAYDFAATFDAATVYPSFPTSGPFTAQDDNVLLPSLNTLQALNFNSLPMLPTIETSHSHQQISAYDFAATFDAATVYPSFPPSDPFASQDDNVLLPSLNTLQALNWYAPSLTEDADHLTGGATNSLSSDLQGSSTSGPSTSHSHQQNFTHTPTKEGETFFIAICEGKVAVVRNMLQNAGVDLGVLLNYQTSNGASALHAALDFQKPQIIDCLLTHSSISAFADDVINAIIQDKTENGRPSYVTALILAINAYLNLEEHALANKLLKDIFTLVERSTRESLAAKYKGKTAANLANSGRLFSVQNAIQEKMKKKPQAAKFTRKPVNVPLVPPTSLIDLTVPLLANSPSSGLDGLPAVAYYAPNVPLNAETNPSSSQNPRLDSLPIPVVQKPITRNEMDLLFTTIRTKNVAAVRNVLQNAGDDLGSLLNYQLPNGGSALHAVLIFQDPELIDCVLTPTSLSLLTDNTINAILIGKSENNRYPTTTALILGIKAYSKLGAISQKMALKEILKTLVERSTPKSLSVQYEGKTAADMANSVFLVSLQKAIQEKMQPKPQAAELTHKLKYDGIMQNNDILLDTVMAPLVPPTPFIDLTVSRPCTAEEFYWTVENKRYSEAKQILEQFSGPKNILLNFVEDNGATILTHLLYERDKNAYELASCILLEHEEAIMDSTMNSIVYEIRGNKSTALIFAIISFDSLLTKQVDKSTAEQVIRILVNRSTLLTLALKWNSKTARQHAHSRKLLTIVKAIDERTIALGGLVDTTPPKPQLRTTTSPTPVPLLDNSPSSGLGALPTVAYYAPNIPLNAETNPSSSQNPRLDSLPIPIAQRSLTRNERDLLKPQAAKRTRKPVKAPLVSPTPFIDLTVSSPAADTTQNFYDAVQNKRYSEAKQTTSPTPVPILDNSSSFGLGSLPAVTYYAPNVPLNAETNPSSFQNPRLDSLPIPIAQRSLTRNEVEPFFTAILTKNVSAAKDILQNASGDLEALLNYQLPNGSSALHAVLVSPHPELIECVLTPTSLSLIADNVINAVLIGKQENNTYSTTTALILAIRKAYPKLKESPQEEVLATTLQILVERSTPESLSVEYEGKTAAQWAREVGLVNLARRIMFKQRR